MQQDKIKEIISQMTLEEKASLCSGQDFWHLKGVERLGIPAVMVADGPHGLRKQEEAGDHLGLNESIPAVCFPAGCASAASFDREILKKLGKTLGNECQAENISTILGPAMNIKRSPLCGRNFEYYSEDPLLTVELAGAFVQGVQSQNVGTSPKHFLANNQETRRTTSSSEVDERTLREIYLAAFEGMVIEQKPWTMMSAYNRINGVFASENKRYMTDVLRDEWGFDGLVMTDWGAMNERVAGLKAGVDIEMPGPAEENDQAIVEAVKSGLLDEAILDRSCAAILGLIFRYTENRNESAVFDREKDSDIAREIAEESIILLKNERELLPLSADKKIAFIGKYAAQPRYQGGGSSNINSYRVTSALDAVSGNANILYSPGFTDEGPDEKMLRNAVETAQQAEVAVIFAGLPDSFESEGYDRKHMNLPDWQNELIASVSHVQPNTVVVLHNGSAVEMPWIASVSAVLEAYLGGQEVGAAVVNILFGKTNPSGRLAETFPLRLEDNPSYLSFGKDNEQVDYSEGVFVGYRYYESKAMEVLFPFGHGLSYTTFQYSNLKLDKTTMLDSEELNVSVDVENTGERVGKEVVQLYVSPKSNTIVRPAKELKGFEKIELQPGEKRTMTFTLNKRSFAYWNTEINDWYAESGAYEVQIGKTAKETLLSEGVEVRSSVEIPVVYHLNSRMGDIMKNAHTRAILENALAGFYVPVADNASENQATHENSAISSEMIAAMMADMPLRQLASFMPGVTRGKLNELVSQLNEKIYQEV